eukprot:COSAG02_NODE_34264_length_486_cov_2.183463_1_plen_75_part_00
MNSRRRFHINGAFYAGESLETLRRGVCTRTLGLPDGASRCVTRRELTVRTGERDAERSLRGDKLLVTRRPRRFK